MINNTTGTIWRAINYRKGQALQLQQRRARSRRARERARRVHHIITTSDVIPQPVFLSFRTTSHTGDLGRRDPPLKKKPKRDGPDFLVLQGGPPGDVLRYLTVLIRKRIAAVPIAPRVPVARNSPFFCDFSHWAENREFCISRRSLRGGGNGAVAAAEGAFGVVKGARGVARSSARGETVRPGWWNWTKYPTFHTGDTGRRDPPLKKKTQA